MPKPQKQLLWGPWREVLGRPDLPPADASRLRLWVTNRIYSVRVFTEEVPVWGEVTALSICRRDGRPVRAWPDLQRIKNEIAGPDSTAIEVYPPEDQVVDPAPIYYLWVLPQGKVLPVSLAHPDGTTVDPSRLRDEDTAELVEVQL